MIKTTNSPFETLVHKEVKQPLDSLIGSQARIQPPGILEGVQNQGSVDGSPQRGPGAEPRYIIFVIMHHKYVEIDTKIFLIARTQPEIFKVYHEQIARDLIYLEVNRQGNNSNIH